jgi:tetratricopeptide (TPR) repeat protein
LDEAIQKRKHIINTTPKSQSDRAIDLNNLAGLLLAKNTRSGALSDLIEASDLVKQGIKDTPKNNVYRGTMLATLATILGTKASKTGEDKDLNEAIDVARQVLQLIPPARPERVRYSHNLAKLLWTRYSKSMKTKDLKEAIKMAQEAVEAAPADFPHRASLLTNLGTHLAESYDQTKRPMDLEKAKECLTSAIYHSISPTQSRVAAGRYFLLLPDIRADLDQAYKVAKFIVELIPLLNSRSLQNVDRQALLIQAVAIASDAAAIALLNNRSTIEAVQLLETGRNIIASSLQDLRTDLSVLLKEHPDQANRFIELREQLDAPATTDNNAQGGKSEHLSREVDRQHDTEEQLKNLLEDIRVQSGFEDFLLAPSAENLLAAAKDGPIAIINVSQFGCHALIIERSGSRTVPLPALFWDDIHHRNRGSLGTLEWLWDAIVSPVLNALGFTQKPPGDDWPHIWWIPTGRLVGFPLHAAGYHLSGGEKTVLDRVVSSYSASVKTIIHTRRQQTSKPPEPHAQQDLVLVAMETTPKQSPLRFVMKEIQAIREVANNSTALSPKEPSTFKKDVLTALRSCSIFHFAGHGGTDSSNPLQSHLLLSDWLVDLLSVENVLDTNLGREMPFLAYLSACSTSKIETAGFVDEAIHVASAFQLAGFQHVIGTLWEVNDQVCVDMAKNIYGGLLKGGMSSSSVSRSLHKASRELRGRWIGAGVVRDGEGGIRTILSVEDDSEIKPLWVPYVHYGI